MNVADLAVLAREWGLFVGTPLPPLLPSVPHSNTIVHTGTILDWTISNPAAVGDGSENLSSVVLSIVNSTGVLNNHPVSFDAQASGFGSVTGQLHQHHSTTLSIDTPVDSAPQYATLIDTHFIQPPGGGLQAPPGPLEDYNNLPSAEATDAPSPWDTFADTDFGTSLTVTAGRHMSIDNVFPLAEIVVPDGSTVTVHGQAATAVGVEDQIELFSFIVRRNTFGDINGDGVVDVGDLALVGAQWGTDGLGHLLNWNADIAPVGLPDGVVDVGDMAVVGNNWTPAGPTSLGGAAPVPGPIAGLSGLVLMGLLVMRRRQAG